MPGSVGWMCPKWCQKFHIIDTCSDRRVVRFGEQDNTGQMVCEDDIQTYKEASRLHEQSSFYKSILVFLKDQA